MSDISVLGLGQMGAALARALLASGRSVTVWNRSLDVFVDQMPLTLKAAGLYADNFQRKAPDQNYDETEASLETYLGALNGILNTFKETETIDDFPRLMRDLAQRGFEDGHAEKDVTVLIETLLKNPDVLAVMKMTAVVTKYARRSKLVLLQHFRNLLTGLFFANSAFQKSVLPSANLTHFDCAARRVLPLYRLPGRSDPCPSEHRLPPRKAR